MNQKDLILNQLANLCNSMLYYKIPANEWDGKEYPIELIDPTQALQETGQIEYFASNSRCNAVVIPLALLSEAAELICQLDEPGIA